MSRPRRFSREPAASAGAGLCHGRHGRAREARRRRGVLPTAGTAVAPRAAPALAAGSRLNAPGPPTMPEGVAPPEGEARMFTSRLSLSVLIELCRTLRHYLGAGLTLPDVFRQQAKRGPGAV